MSLPVGARKAVLDGLDRLVARIPLWPALAVLSAAVVAVHLPGHHATAWHFFADAADLLLGRGPAGDASGLRLYHDHPELQFGPLAIVAALPFAMLGGQAGMWAAMLAGSVLGLVAVALLLDLVDLLRPGWRAGARPSAVLAAAAAVVVTWGDVAVRTAHLDDAVALTLALAGARWCAAGSGTAATVALAAAAATKPWAVAFLPLAAVPAGTHRALRPLAALALVGAVWAPFVIAEPATLDTARHRIENDATSVLRALGVDDATTPRWVRPAQLAGGTVLVAGLVAAGRWHLSLLAAVAWRLLLEPGAHRYYTVGFVLGALLVELRARPRHIPWLTLAAATALEVTAIPGVAVGPARAVRLATVVLALAALSEICASPVAIRRETHKER